MFVEYQVIADIGETLITCSKDGNVIKRFHETLQIGSDRRGDYDIVVLYR